MDDGRKPSDHRMTTEYPPNDVYKTVRTAGLQTAGHFISVPVKIMSTFTERLI